MAHDEDGYWLDCIRRSGSNSVTSGYQDIVDFVVSGRADNRTLSGMHSAFRALAQQCRTQLSERLETERLARYNG